MKTASQFKNMQEVKNTDKEIIFYDGDESNECCLYHLLYS